MRVFPLFATGSGPPPDLALLRERPVDRGIATRLVPTGEAFQKGPRVRLECVRR